METETKTDNELIDAFYVSQGGKPSMKEDLWFYESDFGMLMNVVEKVQHLDDSFSVTLGYGLISRLGIASHYTYCHIENWKGEEVAGYSGRPTLIEVVYKTLTDFIKWYNNQKEK